MEKGWGKCTDVSFWPREDSLHFILERFLNTHSKPLPSPVTTRVDPSTSYIFGFLPYIYIPSSIAIPPAKTEILKSLFLSKRCLSAKLSFFSFYRLAKLVKARMGCKVTFFHPHHDCSHCLRQLLNKDFLCYPPRPWKRDFSLQASHSPFWL